MALVTQTIVTSTALRPLRTFQQQPARDRSGEPYAVLIGSANQVEVDLVDTGNDGLLNINTVLPPNNVYILRSFQCNMSGQTITPNEWMSGWMQYSYQDALGNPMDQYSTLAKSTSRDATRLGHAINDTDSNYTFGAGGDQDALIDTLAGNSTQSPMNLPCMPLLPQTFRTSFFNDVAGGEVAELRYMVTFLVFDMEQEFNSGLFWPVAVRQ